MRQVVIIDHEPYSDRKSRHYYIPNFQDIGVKVEYWSLVDVLPYMKDVQYNYRKKESFVHYISSREEYKMRMSSAPNDTVFIIEMWFRHDSLSFFYEIRKHRFKWIKIDYYFNPTGCLNVLRNRPGTRFKYWFKKRSFAEFIGPPIARCIDAIFKLNNPNKIFLTGKKVPPATNIISINYFDIEEFRESETDDTSLVGYTYLVFLDTMLVDHPDGGRADIQQTMNPEMYYNMMRSFFDKIEANHGYKVVIAAHPKSDYNGEFGDREVLKNQTRQLVKYSEAVLTHGSLSIDFAMLYQKPFVYIKFAEMEDFDNPLFATYQRMLVGKQYTGAEIVDVKDEIQNESLTFSRSKYDQFLEDYYIGEEIGVPNFQVIYRTLVQLHQPNA